MTRTTLVLAVVGAFVLGSIATGTMTYAAPGGSGDSLIVAAINALTKSPHSPMVGSIISIARTQHKLK